MMAIHTRFGGKIEKVISAEKDDRGQWWLKCEISYPDDSPDNVRECSIADLRANNGLTEIMDAIKLVTANNQTK